MKDLVQFLLNFFHVQSINLHFVEECRTGILSEGQSLVVPAEDSHFPEESKVEVEDLGFTILSQCEALYLLLQSRTFVNIFEKHLSKSSLTWGSLGIGPRSLESFDSSGMFAESGELTDSLGYGELWSDQHQNNQHLPDHCQSF